MGKARNLFKLCVPCAGSLIVAEDGIAISTTESWHTRTLPSSWVHELGLEDPLGGQFPPTRVGLHGVATIGELPCWELCVIEAAGR